MRKIYSLILTALLLLGASNAWGKDYIKVWNSSSSNWDSYEFTYSSPEELRLFLSQESSCQFKIQSTGEYDNQNNWYGNTGTITSSTVFSGDGWDFSTSTDGKCTLNASEGGYYTFQLKWSGSTPYLKVVFPSADANHATYTVYYDNSVSGSSGWGDGKWGAVYAYVYSAEGIISKTWAGTQVSKVGTSDIYSYSVTTNVEPTSVIWNRGESGEGHQTCEFNFINGMTYKYSGNKVYTYESYTRSGIGDGNFATVCLPFAGHIESGDKLFTIAGIADGILYLAEEESGNLAAGYPYIIKGTSSALSINITNQTYQSTVQSRGDGLVGTYSRLPFSDLSSSDLANAYVVRNSEIQKGSVNSGVVANRAYIDISDVDAYSPVPGRRIITVPLADNNATNIEAINNEVSTVKFFENGKLYIMRDGIVYDAIGRQVK